ncbi:unnamed protein product [Somion occarium]|uniref:Las1-domain-containing protein n=1 Tax=Somion occarium TaxID=3059160 RepID=A0ABP1CKG4_9APHY
MRLPRRVPWASVTELDQVCSWIYADEFDLDAKRLAMERLAGWRATTSLPHAIESTHAILSAILQDSAAQGSSSYLSLRQSYAAAIIRLVNGLVDPLQLGAYARSIGSIAAQLGLPAWLVELRHAATHEDLPSIELLRQAAHDMMAWLLNNYWLPTLNPSAPSTVPARPLRPLDPLLKQYKDLLKAVTRDASLRTHYQPEINKVVREIERWTSEAKVAANLALGTFDWDVGDESLDLDQEDVREKWALDRLCDVLLAKGILVPQSKKKRVTSASMLDRTPSNLLIWKPLLEHIHSLHPNFSSILISRIVATLLTDTDASKGFIDSEAIISLQDDRKRDLSYDLCLASWAYWLTETYVTEHEDTAAELKREDVLIALISGLGPNRREDASPDTDKAAQLLLKALCADKPEIQEAISILLTTKPTGQGTIRSPIYSIPFQTWDESDLDAMTERLEKLISSGGSRTPQSQEIDMAVDASVVSEFLPGTEKGGIELPLGWRLLDETRWKPAPIGIFVAAE